MKRIILTCIFCVAAYCAVAQKIVSVSGEFTYYAPSTMTLEAAKQEALTQTKLHVLAAKFGTIINSTTTILLDNNEQADASSRADVTTLATHEVKGEWIEDTREPEQTFSYDKRMPNTTIIHTRVWGKAREITGTKAEVDVRLLKEPLKEATSDVFKNEQSFFLFFQSPVAGYLAVYLFDTDEDIAYCLLPSADDSRGAIPVESNREYIFFDSDPEYMFTTERSTTYNHIAVIFSPNEFYKANDEQGKSDLYLLPRELPLKQYQQWLARCKARDTQIVEKRLTVKIVK